MKVLCIHGVNTEENPGGADYWLDQWKQTLKEQMHGLDPASDVLEWRYNQYFNAVRATPAMYFGAVTQAFLSALKTILPGARGPEDVNPGSISMVAKWMAADGLRQRLRDHLAQRIAQTQPDLIIAHSLGSLILYDTLLSQPALAQGRVVLTLGSQIAHPALREAWGGYLPMMAQARHWFHLHNPYDMVLAFLPMPLTHPEFTQVSAEFAHDRPLNHDALAYLQHPQTQAMVWSRLSVNTLRSATVSAQRASALRLSPAPQAAKPKHRKQRALLVGINHYPNEKDRLSGCVNDVFSMSALLQEHGWESDSIRVVLDDRATRQGILERMTWLLADMQDDPDEVRVFYFSGHGAQLTQYDAHGEPDHRAETLVTHDMDWKGNVGITDKELAALYAHLPYQSRLFLILDCCHSGGLTRGSSMAKGINPPDDVAHRTLKWDAKSRLWVQRSLDLSRMVSPEDRRSGQVEKYLGQDGATHKFGRAVSTWNSDWSEKQKTAKRLGHMGAYNPIVITSCLEKQYAYEYRHGVESHGAFTYVLSQLMLRQDQRKDLALLLKNANDLMKRQLQLNQVATYYNPGNKLGLFEKASKPTAAIKKKTAVKAARKKATKT